MVRHLLSYQEHECRICTLLSCCALDLLGLSGECECLVDEGEDTTTSDGRFDESVELFISTNGELQVPRSDTLHAHVFRGIT